MGLVRVKSRTGHYQGFQFVFSLEQLINQLPVPGLHESNSACSSLTDREVTFYNMLVA